MIWLPFRAWGLETLVINFVGFTTRGVLVWVSRCVWRVQFVSSLFWKSRFFVNTTCNLLVKMSESLEEIVVFSFGFGIPNFHPYSSTFLLPFIFTSSFDYKRKVTHFMILYTILEFLINLFFFWIKVNNRRLLQFGNCHVAWEWS